jgi:hypothetical protein
MIDLIGMEASATWSDPLAPSLAPSLSVWPLNKVSL